MQPNVLTSNRASQLGQYQSRSNYDYGVSANSYRSHQKALPLISSGDMNTMGFHNYNGGASSTLFSNVHSANICNISDTVQILHPVPTACNVKFRKLPFFKLRREILKPSVLGPNSHSTLPPNLKTSATQEFQFAFVMTCAMASELSMNRDITKVEYSVQVQLRITMIDAVSSSCTSEYDDFLPLGLVIRVNGRQCTTLPPCAPSSRQNQETRRIPRPISVTHLMKLSPMNANVLTVNWAPEPGKQFIITMNIVEKLSAGFLLDCLKQKPKISVDVTKVTIRQQYRPIDSDETSSEKVMDDEDIATTIVRVSLLCPLAKFRMQYPAKGKNCTHLQCFDGSAYISLNEKKPMWNCPVCNKCLQYDDLVLDEYFMNVIQNEELSALCHEVQLFVDGTWKSYFEDLLNDNSDSDSKKGNFLGSSTERKQLENSLEESVKDKVTSTSESVAEGVGSNCDVVNLLSDDEEDTDNMPNVVRDVATTTLYENPAKKGVPKPSILDKFSNKTEEINDNIVFEQSYMGSSNAEVKMNEVLRTPATIPVTSITTNVKSHQAGGVISLDSPSPPNPAKSSSNDLSS